MKKKGEGNMIGMFMLIFIFVIIGLILFQATAQEVGSATNTETLAFYSLDVVASDTTQTLTNYRALSGVTIYNATGVGTIDSSYYTITNNVVTNGALSVTITPGTIPANYTNAWRLNATAQPTTYIDNAGARTMASLIILFFAIAIALIALYPVYEGKLKEFLGK